MKYGSKKFLLILTVLAGTVAPLAAWEIGETIHVQTLDGYFFPNAELMSVNDGGITICYNNLKKEPVLTGITFDRLPLELRLRYGYDPEKFAVYQKNVGTYRPPEPEKEPGVKNIPAPAAPRKKAAAPKDGDEDLPSLTIAPWDWYYSRPKILIRRYPVRPGHRPHPPVRPVRPGRPGPRRGR